MFFLKKSVCLLAFLVAISVVSSENEKPLSEYLLRFVLIAGEALNSDNFLLAPVNIFHAFTLFHIGSVDETRKELSDIFGFPENYEKAPAYHEKFGNFLRSLEASENSTISPAAGLFVQQDIRLNATYVEQVKKIYDAEVQNVNFAENAIATKTVNDWISKKTNGHLNEFFKEPLNPRAKLQLISALYFEGSWKYGFNKSATKKEDFHTDSSVVQVDMMSQIHEFEYLDDSRYAFRILGLPSQNKDFYFYIQLPRNEPSSAQYPNGTDAVYLTALEGLSSISMETVHLKLPRFSISYQHDLEPVLKKFGSKHITKEPKLDGIFKEHIDTVEINHGVTFKVDETGVVGTAATSILNVIRTVDGGSEKPVEFYVNKPFSFFIYHKPTKSILLFGKVSKF